MHIHLQHTRTALDDLPVPVVVVGSDLRIAAYNRAAQPRLAPEPRHRLGQLACVALRCIHAPGDRSGVGGAHCRTCVLFRTAGTPLVHGSVTQTRQRVEVLVGDWEKPRKVLVTAAPLVVGAQTFALLMLQDASAFIALGTPIAICVRCDRVRDDDEHWSRFETPVSIGPGHDRPYDICPECIEALHPRLAERCADTAA